jgi:hypothetical protein
MNKDINKLILFSQNQNILVPCDEESLPLCVETHDEINFWIGFESSELGQQSPSLDPSFYKWGQISGLQYLKFLHERIEAGGKHILLINPDTKLQFGLDNDALKDFLEWLDKNPQSLP